MAEIKTNDLQEMKPPAAEAFREIRPQSGMTPQEAKSFWDYEVGSGNEKLYYDDNDVLYRVDDHLMPDTQFEKNGYHYSTDDLGRVISAEGEVHLKESDSERNNLPPMEAVGKGDQRETDERGHLIADLLNGSGGIENLVPMDAHLNRSDYKQIENKLANAVKDGAEVYLKVEPVYRSDSFRPDEFRMSYTINGEKTVTVLKNGGGDNK